MRARSNGVQLRAIRLLAKFNSRISDYAYEIYAKMEFYNFILSRKMRLSSMAEFARLNSADLAAGAACGEILRRI